MKSFSEFLLEDEFELKKNRQPAINGRETHYHYINVGSHQVATTYFEDPQRFRYDSGKPPVRDSDHYIFSFEVNGNIATTKHKPKEKDIHLGIQRAVLKSMKEFVQEVKPKTISFEGDSLRKHKYWGKIGPQLAARLGGTFHKLPDSYRTYHVIKFRE